MQKTADEIIKQIVDVLAEADGETIADIANKLTGKKIQYLEDSFFWEYEGE
jgi:hypothetical protein